MRKRHEHNTEVLIVGGGIAGALAAIAAREQGARVTLVDKSVFGASGCSALASGVFHVFLPGDDPELWRQRRGGSLVDRRLYERAKVELWEIVKCMDSWGVRWVKRDGRLVRARAPGLQSPQMAMLEGGGPQMMRALRSETLRREVLVHDHIMIIDFLTSDGCLPTAGAVIGAIGLHRRTGEIHVFRATVTLCCAGPMKFPYPLPEQMASKVHVAGIGMPKDLSGDGIAAGYRAGATLGKMEMGGGSIIPRYLFCAPGMEMFTGLGAVYRNRQGDLFLDKYDPVNRGYASRSDILNAARRELTAGRGPIYLDCRHFTDEQFQLLRMVIPIIMHTYDAAGYDLSRDLIPYASQLPATLQNSGAGMAIDEEGRTSIPGLFAAGNTSDGAYVSISQALPFSALTGYWAGTAAGRDARQTSPPAPSESQCQEAQRAIEKPLQRTGGISFNELSARLFEVLANDVQLVLNGERLRSALDKVVALRVEANARLEASDSHGLVKVHSMLNYLDALIPTLAVMLHRRESRGNVLREDFPYVDNENFFAYTRAKRGADDLPKIWDEHVPEGGDVWRPERTKEIHRFFAEQ
jgi:succinate dehydrogenase / fumarate reductase flavoprotein subunit